MSTAMTSSLVYTTESGVAPEMVTLTCRDCGADIGQVEARHADLYRDTCGPCEDWG